MPRWSRRNQDEQGEQETDLEIDLRDDDAVDLREPDPGAPARCPSCGEAGYLDRINPRDQLQTEHCPACHTRWRRSIAPDAADAPVEILG